MSGFDVTMRSQQQVQQGQQFYDSQRYQMMGQTGQAIAQAPAMLQEISLRQQDADMRLALQQQEFQSNAMKLQAMTAIDQADLMREQVRGAKLQNDAIEFDMSTRREQMGMQREQMFDVRFERLVNAIGGGRGAAASGLKVDPDGKRLIPMTDAEKKAMASDTSGQERQQEWLNLSREMTAAKAMIEDGSDEEGGQQRLRDIAARMAEISTARRGAGPANPKVKAPTPAQQQEQTALDAYVAETVSMGQSLWGPSQTMSSENPNGMPPQPKISKQRYTEVASWLYAQKDRLHEKAKAAMKNGRRNMIVGDTPEETARLLMAYLQAPGDPEAAAFLRALIGEGVLSQEEGERLYQR